MKGWGSFKRICSASVVQVQFFYDTRKMFCLSYSGRRVNNSLVPVTYVTPMRHGCLTLYSRVLSTTTIVTRCLYMKNPPPPRPFNLICGWLCQDLTGLYHGEFHIFWSKLGWNYNNYCQSSFAYLECQKSNDCTKGKAKHYLLLGFFSTTPLGVWLEKVGPIFFYFWSIFILAT